MGVAVRMAVLLKLHREETYSLRNPKPDLIVTSESARRTFVSHGEQHPCRRTELV